MIYISNIMHVLSVLSLHFACSVILQANIGETQTVFTANMFPYVDKYTPINSSTIEINFYPSPNIIGIDLTKLSGIITMTAYAISRTSMSVGSITYPMTQLNETGKIILGSLQPDTIYTVRFERTWRGSGGDMIIIRDITPALVRTYAVSK